MPSNEICRCHRSPQPRNAPTRAGSSALAFDFSRDFHVTGVAIFLGGLKKGNSLIVALTL